MEDSPVQQIKDKLSINEIVGGYVKLERAGRNFRAKCPFHKEKTPSFHVSPERGTYVCFGCGEKGDIFSFVQKIEGVDFPTALRELGEKAGVDIHTKFTPKPEATEEGEKLREVCDAAAAFFEAKLTERSEVQEYLHSRAVTDETIRSWRLGYAPASWRELSEHLAAKGFSKEDIVGAGLSATSEHKPGEIYDRFRGRIMFPISDPQGRIIAFSGRFFEKVPNTKETDEPAKYVNSPETLLFKKSRALYGFDKAKQAMRKLDCILLVEGQFDVVLSHQSGLPFTVAISGTALTPEHLSMLGRLSKRLVLALDADAAGLRSGLKSAGMALAAGFDVKVPTFPEGKDPADIAKENPELLKAAVRTSRTAIEFFLDALRPSARDERGYKKLVEMHILPLIAHLQSRIDQAHFIRIVADRLHVPETAIHAEMVRVRTAQPQEPRDEEVVETPVGTLTQLDRVAGMLLFRTPESTEMRQKLEALLGVARLAHIQAKLEPEAERLRFEFDALLFPGGGVEGEKEAENALLWSIERVTIEEEMLRARQALREAEVLGRNEDMRELMQKITMLVRRKEELRK